MLPLSKPLLAVLTLLSLMYQWNDFLWPLIVLKDPTLYTLPIGLLVSGPIVGAVGFRGLVVLYVALGLTLLASIALVWGQELLPRRAPANAL